MTITARLGVDENGLGARLGPLLVTAALAMVDESGARRLGRRLPPRIAADLDDSKRLVSHRDPSLGEAWARALCPSAASPAELVASLALEGVAEWRAPCPARAAPQCWEPQHERFHADSTTVRRVAGHLAWLEAKGIRLQSVKSSLLCTRRLNDARARGLTRFDCDLHAMERLVVGLREAAGREVVAVCGKVGGLTAYSSRFGPLAGRLHAVVEESAARSTYRFPGLGTLSFVRDADASDPLVMLASLVGKWLREVMMARVARHHGADEESLPSGYHDPRTARFVLRAAPELDRRGVDPLCFERLRDGAPSDAAGRA